MKLEWDAREKRAGRGVTSVVRAPRSLSWIVVSVVVGAGSAAACGGEDSDGSDAHGSGGAETGGAAHEGGSASALGYCDVAPVIESKCLRCHGEPQENNAPFPLTTYEMLVAESPHGSGTPRYERMEEAITSDFMPATWMDLTPPVEDLTEHEEQTLLDWFHAGAPRGHVPCE